MLSTSYVGPAAPGGNRGWVTPDGRCYAFMIAQPLGHSDVRLTMGYGRMVEGSKRVAVEVMKFTSGKVGQVLATWPKQPQLPVAVKG